LKFGNGIKLFANLFRVDFIYPWNLKQYVTLLIAADTKWFKSQYVEVVNFKFLNLISYNA